MNTIQSIYKAPVTIIDQPNETTAMRVSIKYDGNIYEGKSSCHPDDMDFFSKRVGYSLAVSRARIKAMKNKRKKLEEEVYWKGRIYREITQGHGHNEDGSQRFPELWRNFVHAEKRLDALDSAIKNEEEHLKLYIQEQTKSIDIVRRFRNQDKNK